MCTAESSSMLEEKKDNDASRIEPQQPQPQPQPQPQQQEEEDGVNDETIVNDNDRSENHIQQQPQQQHLQQNEQIDSIDNDNNDKDNDNDNESNYIRPKNAYKEASFVSKAFFLWPYKLLKIGIERPLKESDLPEILDIDQSSYVLENFYTIWNNEKNNCTNNNKKHTTPSLFRAITKEFFISTWYIQPLMGIGAGAKIIQAVALGQLIESFVTKNTNDGYVAASILVFCGLVILFEHHHVFFITWKKGMQLRLSLVAAIYDKSLKLSSTITYQQQQSQSQLSSQQSQQEEEEVQDEQQQDTSPSKDTSSSISFGHVTNLASNDVERLLLAALFGSYLIWAPIQAIAILIVGWIQIGISFVVGFAVLICIFVPLQFYLGHKFAYYRCKVASITDQRVNFVSQAVRGARVMKMSGYEYKFLNRIMHYRNEEVIKISNANNLKAWNEAIFFSTNVLISLIILLTKVGIGGTLKEGEVFTVFTLINILQLEMTKHVSLAVMATSELIVSLRRIQEFLSYPEISTTSLHEPTGEQQQQHLLQQTQTHHQLEHNQVAISSSGNTMSSTILVNMDNVTCYWNDADAYIPTTNHKVGTNDTVNVEDDTSNESVPTLIVALKDVSIQFQQGQLTAIIGTVGSGKSALLQAIVDELPVRKGSIHRTYTTLAYAPQDPWIMDGTVKENILFGVPMNALWYKQVIDACGLTLDFQQLPEGDETILGDRGVQCSGGQRARIGCARALYRNADVLVLDDPLSAVDAKVGRKIYQEAICQLAINQGKCVILATHQHQYIHDCRCVLLTDGCITCIGTYDECVVESNGTITAHTGDDAIDNLDPDTTSTKTPNNSDTDPENDTIDIHNPQILEDDKNNHNDTDDVIQTVTNSNKDNKEVSNAGVVTNDTYKNYIRAMGGVWVALMLFLLFCITQASVLVTVANIGSWSNRSPADQKKGNIIGLMIGFGILVLFLSVIRAFISFKLTLRASLRLHDQMAKSVLRAKIQFFDTNPLGRILNRFSADVGIADDHLPPTLFDFFVIAFLVFGALVTAISTLPFILIVLPFICFYFISIRRIFVTSSRELKRLESLARSPIYSMISESLGGIATIRANNSIHYFQEKFRQLHDNHTRAFFSFIAASRWVGFRMDSLVFLLFAIVSFLAVLVNSQGWRNINPSLLGVALSLLVQLAGLFQWCIRQSAEAVNQMVSVERMLEFSNVESEAELECENDNKLVSTGWPSHGAIVVENFSSRYRETLPLSLKNVSFTIPAGARVGIVGRTGSGKSTMVQALFRLLEAETGRIVIDDIDISKVGLHTVRTKISVIPQVPTLFSGCTVRENLDLFSIHPDATIRQVLDDCHLLNVINDLPNGWNTNVAEGGTNFSVGQRQLLCLARSILSKNRILVMDESTANVDRRTDQLLQEALQKSFKDGTIIAVAHRLDTIIDFDLCLVLGNGQLLEYGTPADLIRSGGAFASMIHDTGETMSSDLKQRAFQKEKSTHSRQTKTEHFDILK